VLAVLVAAHKMVVFLVLVLVQLVMVLQEAREVLAVFQELHLAQALAVVAVEELYFYKAELF
jgi:hypothetical protein